MKSRALATSLFLSAFLSTAIHATARADVYRVDLYASTPNYTGTCPIDIVFTATIDGDPGTVFGYQFSGNAIPSSKKLYGFVPVGRTVSLDDDVSIDAAHAGSFERIVEVDDYGPASHPSSSPLRTMKASATAVVTCVMPGSTAPAPSHSAAPTPPTNASTGPPAAATGATTTLLGVSVGDDPATVLARFHLHPPGWGKSAPIPSGSRETAEVREFNVNDTTDMLLVFDKSIEVVLIRSARGAVSTAQDPFGVTIGTSAEKLEGLRGQPTIVVTSPCSDNCRATDDMSAMNGLHDPVESDRTMIFGLPTAVRWEYALKGDVVVSIRVVDCRVLGVCAGGPTPHP